MRGILLAVLNIVQATVDGVEAVPRANFASPECATVLKADAGARNVANLLSESKDLYLNDECNQPDRFVVVELCQDILIDTVILANYEYFSSTFRQVRILGSDSFPPDATGWTVLSELEANNTRGDQTFTITAPQLWVRYVRLEFGDHYGDEVMCPLSTFKVYGTTMLDRYKRNSVEQSDSADSYEECLTESLSAADVGVCETSPANETIGLKLGEPKCYIDAQCAVPQSLRSPADLSPFAAEPVCTKCAERAYSSLPTTPVVPKRSALDVMAKHVEVLDAALNSDLRRLAEEKQELAATLLEMRAVAAAQSAKHSREKTDLEIRLAQMHTEIFYQRWVLVAIAGLLAAAFMDRRLSRLTSQPSPDNTHRTQINK